MITFEQAWADQDDIDALLEPRPAEWGACKEYYWPNNNYGAAQALKEYAGYPLEKPLFAIVPHGVYFAHDEQAPMQESQSPLPAVLSFPEYLDRAYRRHTRKLVIPSAAPYLYVLANMGTPAPRDDARGLIFFPMHSTAKVRVESPFDDVAERLAQLPEEYQPVTVCVHWYDYSIGLHEPFARRGLRIVCSGHRADPAFMYRMTHLMAAHRYAGSNGLGSNACYAIAFGLPYWVVDADMEVRSAPDFPVAVPSAKRDAENKRIAALFAELPSEITQEQRELADDYLGAERFKTPDGLLTDLLQAERVARQGPR